MADGVANRTVQILLLEDSHLDAELIGEQLTRTGLAHSIDRVLTREAFVQAISSRTYDLILADYVLPAFDGVTAFELAHETAPDTPFVFVSGTLGEDIAIEALKRGATDYVVKQRLHRLPSAVIRALAEAKERISRKQAEAELRKLNSTLEQRIEERTQKLEEANLRLRAEIEERRQIEMALQESEQRYRAYFENFPEALFVIRVTPEGGFVYKAYNPKAEEITGRKTDQIRGKSLLEVLPHPIGQNIIPHLQRCVETGEPCHYEVTITLPSGLRKFENVVVPLRNEEGRINRLMGAARDVTDRSRLEDMLRQSQKMEAVGQMTGGVAHDFNNLLTVMIGNLDMIEHAAEDPARVRRLSTAAMKAAERGERLTQQLLAFSRRQTLHPQAINPNKQILEFKGLLERALGESVELRLDLATLVHACRVDPAQFESAILNLAVNARDAMPNGGILSLKTESVTQETGSSDLPVGDYVLLTVSDNGTGIPQDILSRVFEPFFTTKDVGKGSGLGLSQVYGFVRQSGGHVRLDSTPGVGTTISVYLPKSAEAPKDAVATATIPLRKIVAGSSRILIVEDDADVLELAQDALQNIGFDVVSAKDGHEALEILASPQPLDILFTDVVMPRGINGAHLATQAKALRPDIKVLLTSGYVDDNATVEEAMNTFPLLVKPYRQTELAEKIQTVLQD